MTKLAEMVEAVLVEVVAEAIFKADGGVESDEEYEKIYGYKRKLWKTDAPWNTNPDELHEHQRDDYRVMAKAAVRVIFDIDHLELKINLAK